MLGIQHGAAARDREHRLGCERDRGGRHGGRRARCRWVPHVCAARGCDGDVLGTQRGGAARPQRDQRRRAGGAGLGARRRDGDRRNRQTRPARVSPTRCIAGARTKTIRSSSAARTRPICTDRDWGVQRCDLGGGGQLSHLRHRLRRRRLHRLHRRRELHGCGDLGVVGAGSTAARSQGGPHTAGATAISAPSATV